MSIQVIIGMNPPPPPPITRWTEKNRSSSHNKLRYHVCNKLNMSKTDECACSTGKKKPNICCRTDLFMKTKAGTHGHYQHQAGPSCMTMLTPWNGLPPSSKISKLTSENVWRKRRLKFQKLNKKNRPSSSLHDYMKNVEALASLNGAIQRTTISSSFHIWFAAGVFYISVGICGLS